MGKDLTNTVIVTTADCVSLNNNTNYVNIKNI